jgi:HNH endonuclease
VKLRTVATTVSKISETVLRPVKPLGQGWERNELSPRRINSYQADKRRKRIMVRDKYICQLCHKIALQGEADHITPLHQGGSEADTNLQWTHIECHAEKSKRERAQIS